MKRLIAPPNLPPHAAQPRAGSVTPIGAAVIGDLLDFEPELLVVERRAWLLKTA